MVLTLQTCSTLAAALVLFARTSLLIHAIIMEQHTALGALQCLVHLFLELARQSMHAWTRLHVHAADYLCARQLC